jgi:ABC-type sulfate transport system substrate-binding protein
VRKSKLRESTGSYIDSQISSTLVPHSSDTYFAKQTARVINFSHVTPEISVVQV